MTCRKRAGRDGSIELDDEQAEVDDEGGIDGKSDLGPVPNLVLDLKALLIIRTKELVDKVVLLGVELLHLARISLGMVDGHLFAGNILAAMTAKPHGVRVCLGIQNRTMTRRTQRLLVLCYRRKAGTLLHFVR